jgi:hypothetical protein
VKEAATLDTEHFGGLQARMLAFLEKFFLSGLGIRGG